jgi:hypothetical protein
MRALCCDTVRSLVHAERIRRTVSAGRWYLKGSRHHRATEEGAAEIEHSLAQRVGMIGHLSDLYRGLGVPDGLIEPAALREYVGEFGPRDR